MLKCEEFIEKLDKNEITDFTEYIENATIEYLVPMARRGIEVENLIKRGEETIVKTLIRHGHAQEYYSMWKHHSEPSVLIALAESGWFSDYFAKDNRCAIRAAVVVGDPSYIPKLMKRTNIEWESCYKVLSKMQHPDPEIMKAFIDNKKRKLHQNDAKIFKLKYESITKEPTVLENTMTPYELFMTDNPLWAREISAEQIFILSRVIRDASETNNKDILEPIFDQLLTTDAVYKAYGLYKEQLRFAGRE